MFDTRGSKRGTTMAKDSPPDPAAAFRELVTQWERNINSVANQVMGTESFSRLMQEMQRMQLAVQQATSEAMGRRLAAMNMPTREDVIRVAEKLADVERRLAHIEASLDGSAPVAPPDASSSGRPRTRQPPVEYLQGEKPR
jgi:polyhydroxyalkanoic acid synthase PhaR subunit